MITEALRRISQRIQKAIPNVLIQEGLIKNTKFVSKLYITHLGIQIVIEPNLTLRGSIFPIQTKKVSSQVSQTFGATTSIAVVSNADLYGGKICAALDRQHPRDLFDIKILLENEGITDEIRKGFVITLCSHDESISQSLSPRRKDISDVFQREFAGMSIVPVTLDQLIQAREKLITTILKSLTNAERKFLLSIKQGDPQWKLMNLPGIEKLPAIQWKLANIRKMNPKHHRESIEKLKKVLEL